MQITGDFFMFQNAAQKAANAQINPLLKQAQQAVEQQSDTGASNASAKETEAKIRKTAEEIKMGSVDRASRKAMEELTRLEESFYGALGRAASELDSLVRQQDLYASVVDGTADYGVALYSVHISSEDRQQFGFDFMDFQSYLDANGYERKDGLDPSDKVVYAAGEYFGAVLLKEDQAPFYEQWKEEKRAHEVEALKRYATDQLPKIQDRIEAFPKRVAAIHANYMFEKMKIMAKLPGDPDLNESSNIAGEVEGLFGKMDSIDQGDGKKMLDLLKQILEKQQSVVKKLGGTANDINYIYVTPTFTTFSGPLDTYA